MPTFEKLKPEQVVLGRGRSALIAREPYLRALREADAGRIMLDEGDSPDAVKRLLRRAAQDLGIKIRSSWEDDSRRSLVWRRTRSG